MAMRLSTSARDAACNGIVDLLDTASATVAIYTGSQTASVGGSEASNTLLGTCTFSAPAFGASSTGTATANSITSDSSADNSGTAGHFLAKNSGGTVIFDGTCGQGSGDLSFNDSTIVAEGTIAISSFTVTVPIS